jgi:DNA-binding IclR family transcriptional regulator
MPLQYITAFLLVALKEGQTVTELAARAGISASLMTRHLADLGQVNWYHKDGYDLIESELIQWTVAQNGSDLSLKGSASPVAREVSGN